MQKVKIFFKTLTADDLIFFFVALTFGLLPTGTAPPVISLALAFAVWILSGKFMQIPSIVKQTWFWPVIPFMILPWIGLLYSQNLELGYDYAEKTKYWFVVFLISSIRLSKKRFNFIVSCLMLGLFLGSLLAFLQFFGFMKIIDSQKIHYGFGVVHTLLDVYLVIGVLMLSVYYKKSNSKFKCFIFLLLILVFIFHIAILRGRSGYVMLGLLSPILINNIFYKVSMKFKFIACLLLICSLFASPVVRDVLKVQHKSFVQNKEKILKGEKTEEFIRIYLVSETIKIIKKNIIWGIGTGSLTKPTLENGHKIPHPHNSFLYMWVSFGLPGVFSFFWLFGKMFIISWNNKHSFLGYFILSSCYTLFLGGLFDTQILNTGTLIFLCLSYGFLYHVNDQTNGDSIRKVINNRKIFSSGNLAFPLIAF